jgi:histidine triad (HIT) family protein
MKRLGWHRTPGPVGDPDSERSGFLDLEERITAVVSEREGELALIGYSSTMRPEPEYQGTDFYCDVAIPDPTRLAVVHEDDLVLAFHHTRPFWRTHIVVVPKQHIASLTALSGSDEAVTRRLLEVVVKIAAETERTTGAAAVLTNLGDYQDSKHLHVHVHSGPPL